MENSTKINTLEVKTTQLVYWISLHEHVQALINARIGIEEVRLKHPQSTASNVQAVYMSPWASQYLTDKFNDLIKVVEHNAYDVSKQFFKADLKQLNLKPVVTDCWGVIYEESDFVYPHTHFPADLSAVIYLDAEEGCAPIIFGDRTAIDPKPGLCLGIS